MSRGGGEITEGGERAGRWHVKTGRVEPHTSTLNEHRVEAVALSKSAIGWEGEREEQREGKNGVGVHH